MSVLKYVVVGSVESCSHDVHVRQSAPLQHVSVTGVIRDAVAQYTLVQSYVNPLKLATIEAAYVFPLYEGVAVSGFEAEVDGKKIVGEVKEKVAARQEYKEAVRVGKVATLLEQETPDVFQASVGNIPPLKKILIRITLVSEIKQDGEEDQIRFVLPTTIAPRYGTSPFYGEEDAAAICMDSFSSSSAKLSVNMACAMSKAITSVQSPSHTIEIHLGTSSIDDASDSSESRSDSIDRDPSRRARVSLTSDSLMDRDLVIIVKSLGLDQPRALVERHPRDGTHAVCLTFSPRFQLQPYRASELIFLVDRSGSMEGSQIKRAREALELFLRSIPFENHYFNIVGFGSNHSFLFPQSTEYNAESLTTSIHYAQTMNADMGGTEIAEAIQGVFQRRRRKVPMQIFLVTDGEIWDVDSLASTIRNAVEEGEKNNSPLRVFSLGVGDSVSHHLIESVARAGGGFSQLVMKGERMEKKVVNMLKAGLTPSVTNACVKWAEVAAVDSKDEDFVMVGDDGEGDSDVTDSQDHNNINKPVIDLFSTSPLAPPAPSDSSQAPADVSMEIQQAPFKVPVLSRGVRFTMYAILSATTTIPKELVLAGSSPDGPVELRVKIESVQDGETMLHCLAARLLVRDLEEGSSCIHALGKALTVRNAQMLKRLGVHVVEGGGGEEKLHRTRILPLSFNRVSEMTKQKILDIALKYNLSTRYSSWVAIDKESRQESTPDRLSAPMGPDNELGQAPSPSPAVWTGRPLSQSGRRGLRSLAVGKLTRSPLPSFLTASHMLCCVGSPPPPLQKQQQQQQQLLQQQQPLGCCLSEAQVLEQNVMQADDEHSKKSAEAMISADPYTRLRTLLRHQSFDGLFALVPEISALFATTVGVLKEELGALQKQCESSVDLAEAEWEAIWATCLAVEFMKRKLSDLQEEWELVVEKAERRVESLLKSGDNVARFKAAAEKFSKS